MDAIKLLEEDHKLVKRLLKEHEELPHGQPERKRAHAERIIRELMVHERIEEEIFYPAYKRAADEEGRELVAEAKEEHHVVDLIIEELQSVELDAEDFDAKFTVLKENVEHHIKEEEEEMFPDAKKLLKDKLETLGDAMLQYKEELTAQIEAPASRKEDAKRAR
ncbi:MAG TPA: hemerythrin domain-containing protein [Candidatus Thermoplasmatota archaeon]|nr:hemerythrin domain-containing protein [Candidatus Thermoplasmatota archaeon]